MNIIITAHAHVKPVKDPEMLEDYDAFEIKCHEMVSSLWKEYVDALFFIRFKTYIHSSDDNRKSRAISDGKRIIYTRKQPAFQAKNRYGMPPEMEFREDFWNEFMKYAKKSSPSLDELKMEVEELYSKVTDEAIKVKIANSIEIFGNNIIKLTAIRDRMKEIIK